MIFQKLPNLRVAFAHGGGSFGYTLGRISHGFHVRPDLCAIDNNYDPYKVTFLKVSFSVDVDNVYIPLPRARRVNKNTS